MTWPLTRGIDLSGGTILVYEVDPDKKRNQIDFYDDPEAPQANSLVLSANVVMRSWAAQ